jgi:hypothetical protein
MDDDGWMDGLFCRVGWYLVRGQQNSSVELISKLYSSNSPESEFSAGEQDHEF